MDRKWYLPSKGILVVVGTGLILIAGWLGAGWWEPVSMIPPADATLTTVYRGIGHGGISKVVSDPAEPEVPENLRVERDGQAFYAAVVQPSDGMRAELELLKAWDTYETPFQKKCGDFHADFEADWQDAQGRENRVQICLTCSDARCFRDGKIKQFSLAPKVRKRLKEAWETTFPRKPSGRGE